MKSMTGYGRGEATHSGIKVTAEISSVNRKQGELSIFLPREWESLETRIREVINKRVSRGRLTTKITLHAGDDKPGGQVQLNRPLARAYVKEFRTLAAELKIDPVITLDLLLKAPGVLRTGEEGGDIDAFWPAVERAVNVGLDALIKMREREGSHLAKDLRERISIMKESVRTIKAEAPEMLKRYRKQLQERIKAAGLDLPKEEDERLLKEIVYFADRSDISEEVTRLESHFKQFEDCVRSKEPVGRTLDFLAQEMNREINTIGSKSSDSSIGKEVVLLKAELEKFREQVQNVE
ncbi:MAG: YicC/YloC family endoribonuclease [Verrucomicrobiota bacterium]|nr:YicC/YloC family endoribonuclease [Verrucomicrobiota bacterium]